MVRTYPASQQTSSSSHRSSKKGSIGFLLNSSPNASVDMLDVPSSSSHRSTQHGFDHLLTAAHMIHKDADRPTRSTATTEHSSASHSASHSRAHASAPATASNHQEVVQTPMGKRRKRQNIECKECGRTFGDSSSARKHHRVVHLKIKEFACDQCGKTFAEKSNRSKHYIAAHLNQRSHACPDCDKVFNFTDGLRRHRNNVHLGLRPYPCQDCNTSYKQKTHLLKHRQSVHGIPMPARRS